MSDTLATVILGIVGVVLSLLFSYIPAARAWLDSFSNKGAVMLGLVFVVSLAYFGLACSPYAANFNIALSCDQDGVFALLKALFIIASGNQLAYLYTK